MTMRSEAITHMADAIGSLSVEEGTGMGLETASAFRSEQATRCLNALLLFLTEHIEEWDEAASADGYWANEIGGAIAEIILPVAVAALRGTTGKPGEI